MFGISPVLALCDGGCATTCAVYGYAACTRRCWRFAALSYTIGMRSRNSAWPTILPDVRGTFWRVTGTCGGLVLVADALNGSRPNQRSNAVFNSVQLDRKRLVDIMLKTESKT